MNKAVQYAEEVIQGKWKTGKYIKKLCENFLNDLDKQKDENFPYFFSEKKAKKY